MEDGENRQLVLRYLLICPANNPQGLIQLLEALLAYKLPPTRFVCELDSTSGVFDIDFEIVVSAQDPIDPLHVARVLTKIPGMGKVNVVINNQVVTVLSGRRRPDRPMD